MKNGIIKAIEEAYRKGLREGVETPDISPHLITSQVVASEIYNEFFGGCGFFGWEELLVKEPNIGQWLLIYAKSGRYIAWYDGEKFSGRDNKEIKEVTHWRQIPEPNQP